jgi:3'-phosphoadenosine 5'-phosphosulfate sulfotransferase (PAPS reductase)/FAD synthetase
MLNDSESHKLEMTPTQKALDKNKFTVITCGAGLNFTALITEWHRREMPRPDLIIFADTGSERARTYQHIVVVNNWLMSIGYPEITVVFVKDKESQNQVKLHELCLKTKTLPAPAFGFKSCSMRFKVEQVDKFLNNYAPSKSIWGKFRKLSEIKNKITRIVGFDFGEGHRTYNADCDKYDVVYPLVDWEIDREDCEEIVANSQLPLPIKSSCYMCPNMKSREIVEMAKNEPEALNAALKVEDAFLSSDNAKGRYVSVEILRRIDDNSMIGIVSDMEKKEVNYLLGNIEVNKNAGGLDLEEYQPKAVAYIVNETIWQPSKIRGLGRSHSWREVLANPELQVGSEQNCICSEV